MAQKFHSHTETFTGMFEVHALTNHDEFVDFYNWDRDKIFRNIYLNGYVDGPIEVGAVYMMTVTLDSGIWKAIFSSPRYEEIELDPNFDPEDPDNDPERERLKGQSQH